MTTNTGIYQDIATRTAGDIYIGVVGPVRAGKSTFIKRFMETQIIPNIDNVYRRERAQGTAEHPHHPPCLPPRARPAGAAAARQRPHGDDLRAEVRARGGRGHRAR